MTWQLLLTISILSGSAAVVLQRYTQKNSQLNPLGFIFWPCAIASVLLIGLALIRGFDTNWALLPKFNLFLSLILWPISNYFYVYAMKHSEASQYSILYTTRVFWTILVAIVFLHERFPEAVAVGAIFLFVSCVLALWEEGLSLRNYGTIYPLSNAFLAGTAIANDGIALSHGYDVISYFTLSFMGTPVLFGLLSSAARSSAISIARNSRQFLGTAMLAALYVTSAVTLYYAFGKGQELSILISLSQIGTILVVISAAILLKERRYLTRRLAAAVVSFIGVLFIINA
ncbi:DMT family transporter [Candidatus Saccharibacteria bacterium]|nr:DMT family transporter [Candidatus Saccharibacteria bacterium]